MPENRFPKICFDKLRLLSKANDTININYNWFDQVSLPFFEKIDRSEVWRNPPLEVLISEKQKLFNRYFELLQKQDSTEMMDSTALLLYPVLKSFGGDSDYLNLKIAFYYKKIIAQLRLLNKYNPRIITKNKIFRLKNNNFCHQCSADNNIFHSITDCVLYYNVRNKLFVEVVDRQVITDIFSLLNNLNESRARKLVNLLCIIQNNNE